ncbi:MAG: DUF4382 domain-containing protein [Gammaproteobacteria bacterium]
MFRLITRSAAALCILLLISCGGGSTTPTLGIYVADAPIDDVNGVYIQITEIDVTGDNGTLYYPFNATTTINFYGLQGGLSQFLLNVGVPEGHYTSITIHFQAAPGTFDSYITLIGNNNVYPLVIPTGAPSVFTLPVSFVVIQNINAAYTIDLNLRSSILPDPTNPYQYILRPVLYTINNNDQGSITGTVATTLIPSGCSPTIYVYSGNVTPTDVNVNAPSGTVQPISSALVGLNYTTAKYNFTVGWLPPGKYTVALTCEANLDDPTTANNLTFTPIITATVIANQTTYVDLN